MFPVHRPLISSLDLAPELSSVRVARRYATAAFHGWHVPADTLDNALTIISELAANAVRHAATRVCLDAVAGPGGSVVVRVTDDGHSARVGTHPTEEPIRA